MFEALRTTSRTPLYFRLVRALPRNYRIRLGLQRLGLLDVVAPFRFHGDGVVYLPLYEKYCWLLTDMGEYYPACTGNFAKLMRDRAAEWDYIDCGANMGLYAAQILRAAGNARSALLFEPNPAYAAIAQRNTAHCGVPVAVLTAAVSDFDGRSTLHVSDSNPGPEAVFMDRSGTGDTIVHRLDGFMDRVGDHIALKLDVEGEEIAAIAGARALLTRAKDFILMIEFSEETFARSGTRQADLIDAVTAIRPVQWLDSDTLTAIDPTRDVFQQAGEKGQCDLIAVAVPQPRP